MDRQVRLFPAVMGSASLGYLETMMWRGEWLAALVSALSTAFCLYVVWLTADDPQPSLLVDRHDG